MAIDYSSNNKELLGNTLAVIMEHVPAHIYWKDLKGRYLGCNDIQANSLGFQSGMDIIGKTDYELPWPKGFAEIFRKNDIEVIETGIEKIAEENSIMNNKQVVVLSQKMPLKNKQGEVLGILGISLDITAKKDAERLKLQEVENKTKLETAEVLTVCINDIIHMLQTVQTQITNGNNNPTMQISQADKDISLTPREGEVLYYLSINKIPKDISSALSRKHNKTITPGTIRGVINKKLYPKFGVYNVGQLIEKARLLKKVPFIVAH